MKYLTAEKQATQFYFRVQMDDNPQNIQEFAWGLIPPLGQTESAYLANIKNEIALLVVEELKRIKTPTPTTLAGF